MRRILAVVLVIAVVAIVRFSKPGASTSQAPALKPTSLAQVAIPPEPQAELGVIDTANTRAIPPADVEATAKAADSTPNAVPSPLCELRGRFTLPGGVPARDVQLNVMGWTGNSDRARQYGEPEHWQSPKGTSDADGKFSIRFDPPRAYQFVLSAKLLGWCESSWRWGEIVPGATVDVGTVELVCGGTIRGRIVDTKGRTLTKGWRVYAEASNGSAGMGHEATRVNAVPDAATGEFLLDDLPPGRVRLSADSRITNWIEGPVVEVRVGEVCNANIEYTGPDNDARITVVTFCRPFYVFEGDPAEIRLTGAGIEPRVARKIEHSSQAFSFEDLPTGSYTVEVVDPRFQPWSRSGVEPGTSVDAHLKGNAAVALRVLDDNGEPAHGYSLDVRFDHANFGPSTFRMLEAKEDPPADGVYDGLIPRDQTFIVHADGFAPCEIPIPDLKAGEVRVATGRLSHGERITGVVVSGPQKRPVAGAKIVLVAENASSNMSLEPGADTREQTSDDRGRFAFEGTQTGDWTIGANRGPLLASQRKIRVTAGSPVEEVEIALPAPAYLSGRLIAPEGAVFNDLRMIALPVTSDEAEKGRMEDLLWMKPDETLFQISATGTFRVGPLPAGDVDVSLRMPDIVFKSQLGSSSSSGRSIPLGRVTLAPDVDTSKQFDVRALFPSTISLRVRVDGAPLTSCLVDIIETTGHTSTVSSVELDARGFGRSAPIEPGRYAFITHPLDNAWIDRSAIQRTLGAGESIEVDIDVHLVAGTLHIVDSTTSAPFVNGEVFVLYEDLRGGRFARARTDAKGDARMQLPLGRFRMVADSAAGFYVPNKSVVFEWTSTGPAPVEVKLPPSVTPK